MKQDAADLLQKGGADGLRDRLDQDISKPKGSNSQAAGAQNGTGQQQGPSQASGSQPQPQPQQPPPPPPGAGPQQPPPGAGARSQQGPQQGPQPGPGTGPQSGRQQGPQQGPQPGSSPRRPQFKLHAFDSITLSTKPNYRVKGFIPDVGLVVIWGPPKCGKSFWTFDIFMHVALGWEYRSHKVKQGPVVYCAVEGGRNFRKRIQAWRLHYAARFRGPVPFWLIDLPINLIKDHKALIAD